MIIMLSSTGVVAVVFEICRIVLDRVQIVLNFCQYNSQKYFANVLFFSANSSVSASIKRNQPWSSG